MSNETADVQETTDTDSAPLEVRTDARLAAAVGAVASIVAIAYLARAIGGGGWLDWTLAVVVGAIAAAHLQSFVDARVPLLVVDEQGVRLRRGRTWHGLPWSDIDRVEHEPRHGLFHDGRVVLVPRDDDAESYSVPLSLSTRVHGAELGLTAALERLAASPDQVVEIVDVEVFEDDVEVVEDEVEVGEEETHHPVLHDPRPSIARGIGFIADRLRRPGHDQDSDQEPEHAPEHTVTLPPLVASATPLPLREAMTGVRAEVRFEGAAALKMDHAHDEHDAPTGLPEVGQLHRGPADDGLESTVVWSEGVSPIARPGSPVEPLVIDDLAPDAAPDPVVGPELAAARTRLALTVDQLAERTRIRPHVIESIEVDDFAPCGGDFYARGHLRTLARVLGVDAAPLLAAYDERYADAPIDARRVFEAELATGEGRPIRGTRGGPNWSVLVAAVMAVVLAWSIARLIMDSPVELHSRPVLNGSPSSQAKLGPAVPVLLDASSGGAHVVVRDGAGQIVFNGDLAFGDSRTVKAAPPVRVQSSDGALKITVDGQERGPLGIDGQPAQNTFAAAE